MRLLVTGGTGFIGRALIPALLDKGWSVTVLTRDAEQARRLLPESAEVLTALPDTGYFDAVINLAGENLSARRWNTAFKQRIVASRLETTQALLAWIQQQKSPPRVLLSGSAVGFYGDRGDQVLDESSPAGSEEEFSVSLCQQWEQLALQAESLGLRVCLLRTGIVLGQGGALAQLLPPFKLGLGGPVGSGRQWMPWIHLQDEVRAIVFLLEHGELSGPFNLTAPAPARNAAFARALGRALRRPALLPMPGFALKLAMGEMAELVLGGQKVKPVKLLQAGFEFQYPQLEQALKDLFDGG